MERIKAIFFILNIGLIIKLVFWEKKATESTWAWILVLLNFPLTGFVLFLLTGQNLLKREKRGEPGIGRLTEDNHVEVLTTGEEKFQAVFSDIQKAKKEVLEVEKVKPEFTNPDFCFISHRFNFVVLNNIFEIIRRIL